MGFKGALAAIAATAVLAGCGAANVEPVKDAKPVPAAATFDAQAALDFAAVEGGTPLPATHRWPCDQPMRISPAHAPGWTDAQVYEALAYPAAYLQALGYEVSMGAPVGYAKNMTEAPAEAGVVIVAVAPDRSEQVDLIDATAVATYDMHAPETRSALVMLNASRNGFRPDIILHELGHVLGLDHREVGTVMSVGWDNTGHFDADETATISCR